MSSVFRSAHHDISFDDFDDLHAPRPEKTDFDTIVEGALSRRDLLRSSLIFGTTAFLLGTSALTSRPVRAASRLRFEAVPANTLDTVTVPPGYRWTIVTKWGDPLWSDAPEFDPVTRGTGASQERAVGDNNDGMALFFNGTTYVFAVNNEYTNRGIAYGNRASGLPETADDVAKGKAAHGISIFEIKPDAHAWTVVKDSPFNRRITADTPFDISGPARGHDLLKTAADPKGVIARGTWNNCGNGRTPWGTYLACEENFNGYFSIGDENYEPSAELKRYGIQTEDWGYGWAREDARFDVSRHPNEPNRTGYVVEIDPFDPESMSRKLTALGRFKHENAEVVVAANGQLVVYMGDDERGEFIYRYVSDGTYAEGANNSELLLNGTLYAAQFDDDMKGRWLALTPESTGMASKADICIHTRQAASAVGATTMDRPEWVAVHPGKAEVYCALTNNKNRGKKPNAGGDATPVSGANPRAANRYGQIVRWQPDEGDHTAEGFAWNLFVLAGNPVVHDDAFAGSENITPDNMFNAPDGIAFDSSGLLWIQTDGKDTNKGHFAGMGNNQMLVGDPETGEIKRFLVGPREAEVTGTAWSPDRKTMFVGIQHPGDKGGSSFPDGGKSVPRSAIVAISREDGGVIG